MESTIEEIELDNMSAEMTTITAKKWKGRLSELEVDQEKVGPTRPLVSFTIPQVCIYKYLCTTIVLVHPDKHHSPSTSEIFWGRLQFW